MKHCLLCDHKERLRPRGADPDVPFICSRCVQMLMRMGQQELAAKYIEAAEAGRWRQAYALYTFVPKEVRQRHPLKKSALKRIT